ncbi:hypothetical protein CG723_38365 [Streptomyces sp. CB01635]|nr:hypothetical protein CG723_38365 [Streptomyces sp. CB01635]
MYGTASGSGQLMYTGSYSDRQNPFFPKMGLLDGMEKNDSMTVAVPRRDVSEQSSDDDKLACEVLTKAEGGQELTTAVCSAGLADLGAWKRLERLVGGLWGCPNLPMFAAVSHRGPWAVPTRPPSGP